MRNGLIVIAAAVLAWPYLRLRRRARLLLRRLPMLLQDGPAGDGSALCHAVARKNTPEADLWTKRNDKHLELTKEAAEERLLFQEAEPRRVWRYTDHGVRQLPLSNREAVAVLP